MRTKEHNKKIGLGVKAYYEKESEEQRALRLQAIEKRNMLKREFSEKMKELFELYNKLY